MAHLLLSGTTGDYALGADNAAYDTAGSIDVRADIEPDAVNVTQYVVSRFNGVDNLWRLFLANTSLAGRYISAGGSTENVTVNTLITAGNRWQVRWVIDFGASEFRGYYRANSAGSIALSSDTGWTASSSNPDAIAITDLKQGADPIAVGATGATGASPFAGKMYRVQMYHGTSASGTLVFDADFSDPTTWTFS